MNSSPGPEKELSRPSSNSSDVSQITVVPAAQSSPNNPSSQTSKPGWVTFDANDESPVDDPAPRSPAEIAVSVQETRPGNTQTQSAKGSTVAPVTGQSPPAKQQTINHIVLENGKIITSIMPENHLCAWIIPAKFNPYKMPKSLISDKMTRAGPNTESAPAVGFLNLTNQILAVEDYVVCMEMLSNDYRFRLYTAAYKRVIGLYFVLMFVLLLAIIVLGLDKFVLFASIIAWFVFLAIGLLGCLALKRLINKGLHHAVKQVNQILLKSNLMVGVEDRGKLSCHKIVIHFMYFKVSDCMPRICELLERTDQVNTSTTTTATVTLPATNNTDVEAGHSAKEHQLDRGRHIVAKHSQSYVKALIRQRLRFPSRPTEGVSDMQPLHCTKHYCICQFLQKQHFERVPMPWYEKLFFMDDLTIAELETGSRMPTSLAPAVQFARM